MKTNIQTYCANCACGKTQCARHRSRHDRITATDLNPQGLTRCPMYLSMFNVATEVRPSLGATYGQKGGAMSWEGLRKEEQRG